MPDGLQAASAAEILGTTCLLPFESIRIRMVSDPKFANGLLGYGTKILTEEVRLLVFAQLELLPSGAVGACCVAASEHDAAAAHVQKGQRR